MESELAIIVPFYKLRYFRPLLEALSQQNELSFRVYVGNDASNEDPVGIIREYIDRIDVLYHRFDENIGRTDLAAQWNRCLSLVGEERWVWVIGDDDIPSSDCVAEAINSIKLAEVVGANIVHVPGTTIDADGRRVGGERASLPEVMSSAEHYLLQLRGLAMSMTLANTIYRRSALQAIGGFISFPKGWSSDHATPLAVADGGPFISLTTGWLGFRMSGENISSMIDDADEKMSGRLMYGEWLKTKLFGWYDEPTAREILFRVYLKTEWQLMHVWPFSLRMAKRLFDHATSCGVERSLRQKAAILAQGYRRDLGRRLRG